MRALDNLKIAVITSDVGMWLMRGFVHQAVKYGLTDIESNNIDVVGFSPPKFELPSHFNFVSLGRFEDYPVYRWSDALLYYLERLSQPYVLLMLEDYWLMRQVNVRAVVEAMKWMEGGAIRFDLSSDRLYSSPIMDVGSVGVLDVFVAPSQDYCLSFQAGIWNVEHLLEFIVPGENPWQAELNGSARFSAAGMPYAIYGMRQWPIRYQIVVNKGKMDKLGGWMFPQRHLSLSDWKELEDLGYDKP